MGRRFIFKYLKSFLKSGVDLLMTLVMFDMGYSPLCCGCWQSPGQMFVFLLFFPLLFVLNKLWWYKRWINKLKSVFMSFPFFNNVKFLLGMVWMVCISSDLCGIVTYMLHAFKCEPHNSTILSIDMMMMMIMVVFCTTRQGWNCFSY